MAKAKVNEISVKVEKSDAVEHRALLEKMCNDNIKF